MIDILPSAIVSSAAEVNSSFRTAVPRPECNACSLAKILALLSVLQHCFALGVELCDSQPAFILTVAVVRQKRLHVIVFALKEVPCEEHRSIIFVDHCTAAGLMTVVVIVQSVDVVHHGGVSSDVSPIAGSYHEDLPIICSVLPSLVLSIITNGVNCDSVTCTVQCQALNVPALFSSSFICFHPAHYILFEINSCDNRYSITDSFLNKRASLSLTTHYYELIVANDSIV